MTTKYVSVNRGSDSTGDGSAANPWKTIGKAIGASPAFALDSANPNTLYVEPGIYREAVVVGVAPSSTGPLAIKGDSDGAGFTAGGYSSAVAGRVAEWRGWSDDHTALTSPCIQGNGASFITIDHVKFTAPDSSAPVYITSGTDWTIVDCDFVCHYNLSRGYAIRASAAAGVVLNLVVDRCTINGFSSGGLVTVTADTAASDWNLGVVVRNSYLRTPGYGVQLLNGAAGQAKLAGGVSVQNCTLVTGNYGAYVYNGQTYVPPSPVTISDCVLLVASLRAGALGQIVEDGNLVQNTSEHTNVNHGANSLYGACPAFDFGEGRLTGLPLAPLCTPSAVGPAAGFGSYGTVPAVDLTGRNRPEGGGSIAPAAGCLERHDTGVQDKVYQDSGSSACLKLVGPASQERLVLVDAQATTLSVKVRWDGNHGDAAKPQAILVAEPQIGVAGQTVTATSTGGTGATPNAYETLTFAGFTPTAKGAVKLRLVSRAAAGNGAAYFDTIGL